ncbi:MAG TPA: M28 family peptidase [bacterium]|jgi:hypothetical protein
MNLKRNHTYFFISIFILTLIFGTAKAFPETADDIDLLKSDVEFLASDMLEGRLTGTPGCEMAADYIASEFESIGLEKPDGCDPWYFQKFDFSSGSSMGELNFFQMTVGDENYVWETGRDWIPVGFSSSGLVSAPVVFAGYGITAEEYDWDDYKDLDVEGKIVFCMSGEPGTDDPDGIFDGTNLSDFGHDRWKTFNAAAHGALALVLVAPPNNVGDEGDALPAFENTGMRVSMNIPVIRITQEVADAIFAGMGAPLSMYQSEIDRHMMPFGADLEGVQITLSVDILKDTGTTWNVAGILPGTDPELKNEYMIIGAHYDHIGYGDEWSRYEGPERLVHNGADDNASGVAGLLELARTFGENPTRRSILFISFSGEELGTLGSIHYMDDPLVPLESTSAMFCMDMVGRAHENEDGNTSCIIIASGSSPDFAGIIPEYTPDGAVKFAVNPKPVGGSDFIRFYEAGIPSLFFFTGITDEYNTPFDDTDTLNYEGLNSIVGAVFEIATEVGNRDQKLTYEEWHEEDGSSHPVSDTPRSVYLGTIPDYESGDDGFFIMGVQPGSPAEEGGLMAGDQIVKVGDYDVLNIYDYSYALGQYSPGDMVEIVVVRDGVEITLTVTFGFKE